MTNEIFEKNLEAFKEAKPSHFAALEPQIEKFRKNSESSSDDKVIKVIDGALGTKNLVYIRKDPAFQAVYHEPDGVSESLRIIRETDLKHPQLIFIFGMGLGYLLSEFSKIKTKETWGIMVIEKDPDIFLTALATFDFTELLSDKDIWFCVGDELDCIRSKLQGFFEVYTTVNRSLKILATPTAIQADDEYYSGVAQVMIPARDQATIWAGNSLEDSFHGLENVLNNIEFLTENPGLLSLRGTFKGKTCLSVAAGPSLNEAWDFIAKVQGKIPIIACDTLVKPLNDRGIKADFITALERDPIVAEFFKGQKIPDRSTLVGPSLLLPDSWNSYEGRKISYCATPGYIVGLGLEFLGPFASGSSAGNLNLGLAEYLGFTTIIMIGHNLAFAPGSHESHVKGTIDPNREATLTEEEIRAKATGGKVPTQDGLSHVYTILEYNLFRLQIEAHIANSKKVKFINTSAKGAKIQGAEYIPLEKAIEAPLVEPYDMYPDLLEAYKPVEEDKIRRRRAVILYRIEEIIKDMKLYQGSSRDIEQKLSSWGEKISLSETKGNRWSLEKLNSKIDETLGIKVEAVNDHLYFANGFISVISPAHLAFERSVNDLLGKHTDNYELKKEFLLHHRQYFGIWNKWIPRILKEYESARNRLLKEDPTLPAFIKTLKLEEKEILEAKPPTQQELLPQLQH